jgi:hypothetical protein
LSLQTAPVLFLNRRQRQSSFDPFTSCAGCSRSPHLGHKNKLYPLSASHPDNAIIRQKGAITNETAMFVYIVTRCVRIYCAVHPFGNESRTPVLLHTTEHVDRTALKLRVM